MTAPVNLILQFYDYRVLMSTFVLKNNDFYNTNQSVVIFLESP